MHANFVQIWFPQITQPNTNSGSVGRLPLSSSLEILDALSAVLAHFLWTGGGGGEPVRVDPNNFWATQKVKRRATKVWVRRDSLSAPGTTGTSPHIWKTYFKLAQRVMFTPDEGIGNSEPECQSSRIPLGRKGPARFDALTLH